MRKVAVGVAIVGLAVLGAREALWRFDHRSVLPSMASPSGAQLAEVRAMPEGSVVPYGTGVFLRSRWAVLLGMQAELVFAGYCGAIKPAWPNPQLLEIECELLEGEPVVPQQVVRDTAVRVTVTRKQAANLLFHPTAFGGG
jgi:hypothetical protein